MAEQEYPVDAEFLAQVRARHGHDLQALMDLGVRIVTGNGAPCSPVNGAAVIAAAAEQDVALAWRYLAGFSAQGLARERSLADAYAAIMRAAALGDAEAVRQLIWLQELRWPSPRDAARWVAAAVDVEMLCAEPRVIVVRALLSRPLCRYLIDLAAPRRKRAEVYDLATGATRPDAMRTNSRVSFSALDVSLVLQIVRMRLAHAAGVGITKLELPEVLHYAVGERYQPHVDFLHPGVERFAEHVRAHGQRSRTALIYLNDDYSGGETDFPKLGFCFKGRPGDALIFDNVDCQGAGDLRTLHEGRAPLSGEKWLLSQWIRDREQVFS